MNELLFGEETAPRETAAAPGGGATAWEEGRILYGPGLSGLHVPRGTGGLGLRGDSHNYYGLANSLLDCVLARRKGLPLSLAVLHMAVGRGAGLDVQVGGGGGRGSRMAGRMQCACARWGTRMGHARWVAAVCGQESGVLVGPARKPKVRGACGSTTFTNTAPACALSTPQPLAPGHRNARPRHYQGAG